MVTDWNVVMVTDSSDVMVTDWNVVMVIDSSDVMVTDSSVAMVTDRNVVGLFEEAQVRFSDPRVPTEQTVVLVDTLVDLVLCVLET